MTHQYNGNSWSFATEITGATGIEWDGIKNWIVGGNRAYGYDQAGVYQGVSNALSAGADAIAWDGSVFLEVVGSTVYNKRNAAFGFIQSYFGTKELTQVGSDGTANDFFGADTTATIWNISLPGGGAVTARFSTAGETGQIAGLAADANYIYVADTVTPTIYLYDAVTGIYTGDSIDCSGETTTIFGISIIGDVISIIGDGNTVFEYAPPVPPTVTTQAATAIGQTSATLNGNVTAEGDATPTTRGFVLKQGPTGDPTIADTVISESGAFAVGAYSLDATGLAGGSSFRVASFVTSTAGTSYGATVDLQLLPLLHPAGSWIDGAESGIEQLVTNAALIVQDAIIAAAEGGDGRWYTAAGVPIIRYHTDRNYNFSDEGVSHDLDFSNAEENKWRDILAYESARSPEQLTKIYKFIKSPLLSVAGAIITVGGALISF